MKSSTFASISFFALALWILAPSVANANDWKLPRMHYGVPDFQGTWTNATITGLERFEGVEELVLTPQQAHRIENGTAALYESIDRLPEGELQAGKDVGGYNTFWMDPGKRLAVVDGEIRSSLLVDPKDGKLPYSWRGRAYLARQYWRVIAKSADDPEQRLLGERCIVGFGSSGGPPMLPVLYNNNYQIIQSPGFVAILVEMNHNVRIIRIDAEHLPQNIRPWLGDSIGHWEDDTLVVETTNFNPGQSFRGSLRHYVYMSQDAKVIERFTRTGEREIQYDFEVHDPKIYTQVWKGEIPLLEANGRIYEYACHEGNYSLEGILAGARAED